MTKEKKVFLISYWHPKFMGFSEYNVKTTYGFRNTGVSLETDVVWRKVNEKPTESRPVKGMKTADEAPKLQLMTQAGFNKERARKMAER
jgi:hypothetical protein